MIPIPTGGERPLIDSRLYAPETVPEALVHDLAGQLRITLSDMLVQPDFSAAAVPAAFSESLVETAPGIIGRVVGREAHHDGERWRPLHKLLGELAVSEVDVQLAEDFIPSLQRQIQELPYDFSELEGYHRRWSETPIMGLLTNIHNLFQNRDANTNWLNEAYKLVTRATTNPNAYTPPLDTPEALMLLCYLPTPVRQLTKRLLVNNTAVAQVESLLGPAPDQDTQTMLAALKQYVRADVLEGQHWNDYAKHHPLSDEHALAMAMQSVARLDALSTIQQLACDGRGSAVLTAWEQTTTELDNTIAAADTATPLVAWQSCDSGHTFHQFTDSVLTEALWGHDASYYSEYSNPPKTGGLAVILEDDPLQAAVWQATINRHTIYTARDTLCFADPSQVSELARNPDVGLYLLDIQNGTDMTAGIRVGTEILEELIRQVQDPANERRRTTIRVWSMSREAVDAATAHFKDFINSQSVSVRSQLAYSFQGSGRSSSHLPIELEVRTKRWSPLSDVKITRDKG